MASPIDSQVNVLMTFSFITKAFAGPIYLPESDLSFLSIPKVAVRLLAQSYLVEGSSDIFGTCLSFHSKNTIILLH
jgi:hypothetical protein